MGIGSFFFVVLRIDFGVGAFETSGSVFLIEDVGFSVLGFGVRVIFALFAGGGPVLADFFSCLAAFLKSFLALGRWPPPPDLLRPESASTSPY